MFLRKFKIKQPRNSGRGFANSAKHRTNTSSHEPSESVWSFFEAKCVRHRRIMTMASSWVEPRRRFSNRSHKTVSSSGTDVLSIYIVLSADFCMLSSSWGSISMFFGKVCRQHIFKTKSMYFSGPSGLISRNKWGYIALVNWFWCRWIEFNNFYSLYFRSSIVELFNRVYW